MPAHSKKGSILKILGIIFLVIIIIIAAALIYFYNFFVFKKLIICITPEIEEKEEQEIACTSNAECTNNILQNLSTAQMPEFLKIQLDETINKAVFCEQTCKNKKIYSNFIGENRREIEFCAEGEEEVSIEIRGKEGIKILNFLRESNFN